MTELSDLRFTDEENKGNGNSRTTTTNNPLSQRREADTVHAALEHQTPPLTSPTDHTEPSFPEGQPRGQ